MKYAAIITTTETIPGDQRSRDYPGHGYGEHQVERTTIKKFKDLAAVEEYVRCEDESKYGKDNYILIQYEELVVKKTVSLEIQSARA
jgi:hypothetical protein